MIGTVEEKVDPIRNPDVVLNDYRIAYRSRQVSIIGRREVLSGKAKFGIFGDGKEVAQVAMAHAVEPGDFRSGYYRDQTLMFALGAATERQFFAQLYADPDPEHDPSSAGRCMNAHFATPLLNPDGSWRDLTRQFNSSADVSPTGSQMPRLVGLAHASRLYRDVAALRDLAGFSQNGNEVAFGTIGNASCAEGMFWEAVNAIGVLRAPAIISIWDDEYGISVTNEHQLTRSSLAEMLSGFQRDPNSSNGYDIYAVKGWDYPALVRTYLLAAGNARRNHIPAIIHVTEMTQPQGHSTSGSHERYKPAERLRWEEEQDGLLKMRHWMIEQGIATAEQLDGVEAEEQENAEKAREAAWADFMNPIRNEVTEVIDIIDEIAAQSRDAAPQLERITRDLGRVQYPTRKDVMVTVRDALLALRHDEVPAKQRLVQWRHAHDARGRQTYASHLYSEGPQSPLNVEEVPAEYDADAPRLPGYQILNAAFDAILARDPRVVTFGEDVGQLGGVNQTLAGLQAKHGELRVADTGIRETTIVGQAIGLAMRGLRPIAEIQYLDYVLYALQIMSDDLATLRWRTHGIQKAPAIIRTRGHRLEGIWHSGSPMSSIVNLVRGMHVLVPRNMTQAAGFYNTLLQGDDPGLVVEVLNGYRLREKLPRNLGDYTIPLGVPEVVRAGEDVTVVTYGAMVRIAQEAAQLLEQVDVDVEIIDVRSLLPFDRPGLIGDSLRKTSRILFVDEDVPGGTTAYMMRHVLEEQEGFWSLDAEPRALSAQPHRPAYGSDGDYWSKPSADDIFSAVYDMMNEADPAGYPRLF